MGLFEIWTSGKKRVTERIKDSYNNGTKNDSIIQYPDKEERAALPLKDGVAGLYTCGPTFTTLHIGNFQPMYLKTCFTDILNIAALRFCG